LDNMHGVTKKIVKMIIQSPRKKLRMSEICDLVLSYDS